MAGRQLRWHQSNKRKLAEFNDIDVRMIPVDDAFWRAWKSDRATMLAAGVKLRKVNGKWQACIELRH
jgi:hypothetical protein